MHILRRGAKAKYKNHNDSQSAPAPLGEIHSLEL